MKYLLDTHVFIWLDNDPGKLSKKVSEICAEPSNILLLSMASVWEMQIKTQLGKLKLPAPLPQIVQNQLKTNRILLLPIELSHVFALANLSSHHKDPFDRLLIAQAVVAGAVLVTDDAQIGQYSVPTIW
jgi:PIN domain nuclease of toxin-antitoxin system